MLPMRATVISAASAAVNQTSTVIPADHIYAISAQAIITGTSTGTLQFEFSNEPPGVGSPSNWASITGAEVSVSGAGVYAILYTSISYEWLRLVFTASNGQTGTITVNVKSIGF